jgi:2-dehydro-3-deoxygluconokinase
VVLKTGADGAWFKTANGEQGAVAAVKVENVVDTVGAGDGFAVGVISALLEGKPLQQAVRAATKLARWPFRCRATAKDYPREQARRLNSLSPWERAG